ncbi:MAG: alpha/beta fold hydrolase [Deltaproteobacteria bacterium]|nr:alpha/beta fold hydrolase [Deltaproteobacteria bacterium]
MAKKRKTRRVKIGKLPLEGVLEGADAERAAVITHPHPLYGGDMDNPVVTRLSRTFAEAGYCALRFNFRGTGKSGGSHGGGEAEKEDVTQAIAFLEKLGKLPVYLAGYSFGAWVMGRMAQEQMLSHPLILVAPPVDFLDFHQGRPMPGLCLVVSGSRDEFGPPELVRVLAAQWNPDASVAVVNGADHFFWNHLDDLARLVSLHLAKS